MFLLRRVTIYCTKIIIFITVNSVARGILIEQKSVLLIVHGDIIYELTKHPQEYGTGPFKPWLAQ